MSEPALTSRQKTQLRSLGQLLDPSLKIGKGGLTPAFFTELRRNLNARELVKIRFLGTDRTEQAALCTQIAERGDCVSPGSVGHTTLFYRPSSDPKQRAVTEKIAAAIL